MKKVLLFAMLLLPQLLAAQNFYGYQPMLAEGKAWTVNHPRFIGEDRWTKDLLKGDTVINGHQMKVCYQEFNGASYASSAYYEVGRKVYVYSYRAQKEGLVFNFDLKAGDKADLSGREIEVVDEFMVSAQGHERRALRIAYTADGNKETELWIEGIGTLAGLLSLYRQAIGATVEFGSCTIGDEILFTAEDFTRISAIRTIKTSERTNNAVYDLSGRRVANSSEFQGPSKLPKGVYIQNGKKFVVK